MQSVAQVGALDYYLVNITYKGSGLWGDSFYVSTDPRTLADRHILEKNILVYCGQPAVIASYESTRGEIVEVPQILMMIAYAVQDVTQ